MRLELALCGVDGVDQFAEPTDGLVVPLQIVGRGA
jgi:hypothetical protein